MAQTYQKTPRASNGLTTKLGRFVSTSLVTPPVGIRLMCREGASVFDAALSKWSGKWVMLVPGHGEEQITPPSEWWLTEEMQRELGIQVPVNAEHQPERTRKGQFLLDLGDSVWQSRRVV